MTKIALTAYRTKSTRLIYNAVVEQWWIVLFLLMDG